jgi:NAD(P)-dependent dehydrogenase (short-subunit alcohol dehydrogenase family)
MVKYLIITGGSRGIGAKTIDLFIEKNWKIINISRTKSTSPNVYNITVDLSQPINQEKLLENFKHIFSLSETHIDNICFVQNAAYYKRDFLPSLSMDEFIKTWQINIVAAVSLNQILIPLMPPGSSIIYMGSTLSEKAVPGSASYAISRHATAGLMKVTCQDLIVQQIRSCCICPGLVNTDMLKESMDETTIEYLLQNKIIGKRLIEPEEIARIIHFCAVTPSINGSIIHANLGQLAE